MKTLKQILMEQDCLSPNEAIKAVEEWLAQYRHNPYTCAYVNEFVNALLNGLGSVSQELRSQEEKGTT